jgi:hypothetical protein
MSNCTCSDRCELYNPSAVKWAHRTVNGEVVRIDIMAGACNVGHLQLATDGRWSAYLTSHSGDDVAVMRREAFESCREALLWFRRRCGKH